MGHHPTHPATVHFPIAFTLLTSLLDTLYYALSHPLTSPTTHTLYTLLALTSLPPSFLPILSYHTTRLTLLVSLPSIITGVWELMPLIKRDGISSPKARVAILHAVINDLTVLGAAFNWWTRRGTEGFVPTGVNVAVSAGLAGPGTLVAAWLGGQLVYQYGMGVGRGRWAPVVPKKNN